MRRILPPIVFLAAASLFAQLPSNTVTISANRTLNVQPDQAVLGLTVTSGETATLDQIVSALAGVGITSSNLSGIDTSNTSMLQWSFTLDVPISNLTATLASLADLEQAIAQNNSGLTLSVAVTGIQVSQQLQQSQQSQVCSNANLVSDATAQAQKLVAAAGMTLGPVLKVSNAPGLTGAVANVYETGEFALLGYVVSYSYSVPLTCSLTVQFQLLP
jgi:hypothetical protein